MVCEVIKIRNLVRKNSRPPKPQVSGGVCEINGQNSQFSRLFPAPCAVECLMDIMKLFIGDVSVNLSGCDVGMPQKRLN